MKLKICEHTLTNTKLNHGYIVVLKVTMDIEICRLWKVFSRKILMCSYDTDRR